MEKIDHEAFVWHVETVGRQSFFHGSDAFPQPELSRQSYKTNFPVPVTLVENIPASDFAIATLRLKTQKNVHLFLRVLHGFL